MKIQELFEAKDTALAALIAKHNLNANGTMAKLDDFAFTAAIADDFKSIGYELKYSQKTNKFDVISLVKKSADAEKQAAQDTFSRNDASGRKVGFKPRRKSGV